MVAATEAQATKPAGIRPIVWTDFSGEGLRGEPIAMVLFRTLDDDDVAHLYSAQVEWDDDELKLTHVRVVGVALGVPKPTSDDLELLHAEVLASYREDTTDYYVMGTDLVRAALADGQVAL